MEAGGRGRHYARGRAAREELLRRLYVRDWPARAWGLLGRARRVRLLSHHLHLGLGVPLRIAFASDLHVGPTTSLRTLEVAFDHLRAMRPDVLVLGGDYVFLQADERRASVLESLVRSVPASRKLAVLGNHDLWTDHGCIERALGRAGAQVLVNDAARLPEPWAHVAILGLDDPWTGSPDADRALAACGDARVRLAVAHAPDAWRLLQDRGVALLLCGHTHGGQIALPGPRPIVLPPGGRSFPWGLHAMGDAHLFVSRGVGATELPMRTFAPPDVAMFTLH